jgi:hypothetical protein
MVANAMQMDILDLTIIDNDLDKSVLPVLDADVSASEQIFRGQLNVAADTDSATYNWIQFCVCAPSLWSSRLGWQSLLHRVNILPMNSTLHSLEESTSENICTRELSLNMCPVYEKYYRVSKMVTTCEYHYLICQKRLLMIFLAFYSGIGVEHD